MNFCQNKSRKITRCKTSTKHSCKTIWVIETLIIYSLIKSVTYVHPLQRAAPATRVKTRRRLTRCNNKTDHWIKWPVPGLAYSREIWSAMREDVTALGARRVCVNRALRFGFIGGSHPLLLQLLCVGDKLLELLVLSKKCDRIVLERIWKIERVVCEV